MPVMDTGQQAMQGDPWEKETNKVGITVIWGLVQGETTQEEPSSVAA